jgi:mannose-6-phosphate isomerase-like protein (cupin superfamily)
MRSTGAALASGAVVALARGAPLDGALVGGRVAEAAGEPVVVGPPQPTIAAAARTPTMRTRRRRRSIDGMYAGSLRAVAAVLGSPAVDAYEADEVLRELTASGRLYHEFIRTHDLSVGLYRLAAGATDPQGPHTEDEVYHVIRGRATVTVGEEERPVTAGSIVFVGADVPHRFHDIEEELVLMVIFGPAEYTHRVDHQQGKAHGAAPA